MKRKISKALIALMLLSGSISNVFAKNFPDLDQSHWAYKQIQSLSDDYSVVGYPDGTFKADAPVTRAEFATMVIKTLRQENAPLTETFQFSDVTYSHWAYNAIQRAIAFDLIQGSPNGLFRPDDNVSKAEAVAIIVSALNAGDLSVAKAKEVLKVYADVNEIPDWAVVPAGKSEIIGMTAHAPESLNKFDANKKASRSEITVNLYNMREQAKLNPNAKLAEAMRPKKGEGIVIDGVTIDGTTATIPKGALIPVVLLNSLNSQTNEIGEVFLSKTEQNLVSKDKYLLIAQGSSINGEIDNLKPARYFIRNGKMILDTKYINTVRGQKTQFPGNIDTKTHKSLLVRIVRYVVKGSKVKLQEGKMVYIKLDKPIKVDLTNGWILE